jgi:hypothetical protein
MIELLFNIKKNQSTRIFVALVYATQSGITAKDPEALSLFHRSLNNLVGHTTSRKKANPHEKHHTIMGGNWNTSIGQKKLKSKMEKC